MLSPRRYAIPGIGNTVYYSRCMFSSYTPSSSRLPNPYRRCSYRVSGRLLPLPCPCRYLPRIHRLRVVGEVYPEHHPVAGKESAHAEKMKERREV